MANHNPSIVVASLDDSQLRKSIDELVQHVKVSFDTMAQYATTSVNAIKDSITSLGKINVQIGKATDSGGTKRIRANEEEANSVKRTSLAYDQMNAAISKMNNGSSIIETYDMQLELLKQRLREVRADIDLYNQAIGSGKKTQIEFGQTGLKKANAEAEMLMRQITELEKHRNSIANLGKPMGESFKNFINDLQSTNPELARLNEQFKRGNSLLQEQAKIEDEKRRKTKEYEQTKAIEREIEARKGTILALREEISLAKKKQELLKVGSPELLEQNKIVADLEKKLKEALKSQKKLEEEWAKTEKKAIIQMPTNDINELEAKLKRINNLVDKMKDKGILSEAELLKLNKDAKKLQETIDKIRNTPKTTKDVIGMPEKTLDDIAKKLQAINQVKNQLNINTQRNEISRLNAEAQRLSGLQNDILGKNQKLITSNRALASAIGYIRNRIIYALTLGATTNFVKEVYEIRGQYELLERSLGVLVNSFENGKKIFQDLNEMAIKSPFTLIELGSAAKQLTAYNFAANEVVDVTRRMADLSAALGVPMERLTYNLGQIRAQTVLTARDARDFANAGLPIVKKLSDYYTELENKVVSTGDVYDRMSKKMVSYNDVMAVLYQMTDKGGKFFDFQAKQAETLRVQLANLTLAFNNMLNEIGEEHQQLLAMPLKLLKSLLENWRTINSVISSVAIALGAYKAAQMLTNAIVGKTVNSIERQIVAEKQLEAARLRKKALTTQLSIEELRLLANTKTVTTADYERLLIENKISAGQAMRLILFNKNNMMLRQAAINTGILTERQVELAASGNYLKVMLKSVGLSLQAFGQTLKSLFVGNIYTLAIMAITTAIWELYSAFSSANEAAESLMEGIKTAANEASASLDKFINSIKEANVLAKISEGSFSDNEGKKVWAGMKEEIQNSVLTANELLMKLEEIDDIGERIKIGNDMLTNLSQAKKIVADISEEYLNISTDTLGGLFGEGLVSDLKDYYDAVKEVIRVVDNLGYAQLQASEYGKNQMKSLEEATEEANSEIEKTFNGFWKLIEKRDIKDPLMIAEMLEHVKDKIKQDNPKIKGELENLFDIHMDELLAEKTDNAYDKNTSLWKIFMKELKKNSNSTFLEIGDQLTESQQKAINENTEYFKESMPQWYEAIKEMVQDASKLKVMIDVTFDRKELTNLQQTFQERIGHNWELSVYMPKENQDVLDWAKELRSQRDDYINQSKALKKIDTDWANTEAKRLSDAAININKSLDLMHQSLEDEKKSTKSEKDVLGEAIKQEISLIKDMQSNYDKLRKAGVGDFEAIELAARGYEATLRRVNAVLSQYGIDKFNASDFAGKNSRDMLDFLVTQRELLTKNPKVKTSAIEALDVEIQKLNIDAKTYDLKKITDGLNNELSKIDEQYELAVELQANADLGNQLVEAFGLDTSQFPQDIDQYVQAYQEAVAEAIQKASPDVKLDDFNILSTDIKELLKNRDVASTLVADILKKQETARNAFKKWLDNTLKGWDKLLEKYSEYEYKVNSIIDSSANERQAIINRFGSAEQKDKAIKLLTEIKATKDVGEKQKLVDNLKNLVNEIAGSDAALLNLTVSIDNKEQSDLAKAAFEEFQKTPEWMTAIGDLSTLTRTAIGNLIQTLEDYKKKAKNLEPEQIKKLNNALRSLYRQQRSRSPFHAIGDALDQAKERAEDFQGAIDDVESKIKKLEKLEETQGELTEEQANNLETLHEKLKKLKEEQKEVGAVSAKTIVDAINSSIDATKKAISLFYDMADALGGSAMTDAKKTIQDIFSVIDKAGSGAAIGAQLGGGKGAIIGAVAGAATGIITVLADVLSGNRAITRQVEKSEKAVKRLELAYKDLEEAVNDAYGAAEYGLQKVEIANKKAQLEELKRQLQLEKSRKSKNYDEDKVIDLQGQIKDLTYEIQNMTEEITNGMLGISSVGDAAEQMVSSMIDAFRNGEDYMGVFYKSFEDMIDGMVMKSIVSKVIGQRLEGIWNEIDERIKERGAIDQNEVMEKQKQLVALNKDIEDMEKFMQSGAYKSFANYEYGKEIANKLNGFYNMRTSLINDINNLSTALSDTEFLTPEDADYIRQKRNELSQTVKDDFLSMMDAWGITYGQDADANKTNLSALQQGIQGITEDTAGALEAYANNISQQGYIRNELLMQIRDALVMTDSDLGMGVQAQMLLQLQQSYQVHVSIRSILEGVLTPSGTAFNAQLI